MHVSEAIESGAVIELARHVDELGDAIALEALRIIATGQLKGTLIEEVLECSYNGQAVFSILTLCEDGDIDVLPYIAEWVSYAETDDAFGNLDIVHPDGWVPDQDRIAAGRAAHTASMKRKSKTTWGAEPTGRLVRSTRKVDW